MRTVVALLCLALAGCGKGVSQEAPATLKACEVLKVENQCLVTIEETTCGPRWKFAPYDPDLCSWLPVGQVAP